MTERNGKWIELLKLADIKVTSEIEKGEIKNVALLNNGNIWRIDVELEILLPVDTIFSLMSRIAKYVSSLFENNAINTQFSWHYQDSDCPSSYLEDYFQKAIKECMRISKSVNVFNFYKCEFLDNRLNVYVASAADKVIASEALEPIKNFFRVFGLDKIEMEINISSFEQDVKEEREKEVAIRDQQADTRVYETKKMEIALQESNTEKKVHKDRRSNIAIRRKLKELPVTSMQVMEFKQKNSTDIVVVEGVLVKGEVRKAGQYELFEGVLTDNEDSITIKQFLNTRNEKFFKNDIKPLRRISVRGSVQYDNYIHDVAIMCLDVTLLGDDTRNIRIDESPQKRVELHAHTKMSTMDSVMDIADYVATAKRFNHKAIAVTDHANCHALPEFFDVCKKANIKPIAGVEGYFINDDRYRITLTDDDIDLNNATYVVFDLETSGFSVTYNEIIEIGAVKIKDGVIIDQFSSFVQPRRRISHVITNITEITNDDLANAPTIEVVLPKFVDFIKGCVLVAHNATFDTGHLYQQMKTQGIYEKDYPCIDTMQLAKAMYSDVLKRFNLKDVAKGLKVELEQQHRALSDAKSTSNVFLKMLGDLSDYLVYNYKDINGITDQSAAFKYIIPTHINILVMNRIGLRNFYRIISDSHTTHFHREARILKSVLSKYRENLLIGSGCYNGEVFRAAYEKSYDELLKVIEFYDYVEVQPLDCYDHLVEAAGDEIARDNIKQACINIIKAAKEKGIMVIATGDVHQVEPSDGQYREVFMSIARPGGGLHELNQASHAPLMYYRTTNEMLKAFDYLSTTEAYEIVVENTNKINNMIEEYDLFPNKLFTPRDDFMAKYGVPSMQAAVRDISYENARRIYGDILPNYVEERLEKELKSIIGNNFSSVYYISHMLVKNSNDNGYVVGSRGSVGSSFVATMMKITEVNPLKPHYGCPVCHFSAFKDVEQDDIPLDIIEKLEKVGAGQDLEECACPHCGTMMNRDGIDIPFETFLGFKGEKVPDIDLNFSGDYQERAHLFCREVFGIDNAFRAGTIGTVAEKTAYGFVRGYLENKGKTFREAEVKRIANGLIGAKRTTGQHPGGIVVVPDDIEYVDIIPVQYPADSVDSTWRTSHFDYHRFESNLLKLDILGHDDPTMIRHLMDYVHKFPDEFPFSTVEEIPLSDPEVISLFSSKEALKLMGSDNDPLKSGTIGIPEFGTRFVRDMLNDISPKSFNEIVKVSGLSHGTDVWLGNAKDLILGININEPVPFLDVIGCRDDIMVYLMQRNLPAADAFSIMEHVRKGKGLKEDEKMLMRDYNIPEWYISSCQKIQYMFPKAHATAYVIMALRIGWFKVHRPIYYYAAYFSCRASAFDVDVLASGRNAIRNRIAELNEKISTKTASNKEIDLLNELQIALELYLRGYSINQVDINKSEAKTFVLSSDKKSIYLPFCAVDALGESAALSVIEARNQRPFTSKKDVEKRTKLNKTTFNRLKVIGTLDSLPDEDVDSLL